MNNIVLIIFICIAALAAVIAIIAGLVKGYTKTKTWGAEYLFAVIISVLIYSLADLSDMSAWLVFGLKVGTAVALILVFALLSSRGKALFKKCIANAQKRSYYMTYGDREENKMLILDAIENGDGKAYRKLTKRKFKESKGAVGVVDRICGAIVLLFKAVVIVGLTALILLVVLDFTQLPFVEDVLGEMYKSGAWAFFSRFAMDAFVIGILFFAIRGGYRAGVVSALWVLAVLALIGGAGYLCYWLCFNVDAFIDTAASLNGAIGGVKGAIASAAEGAGLNITAEQIAQGVLAAGIFVLLLIVILVVGIVVAGIIGRAREGKAFSVVDGVFGAIVAFAIVGAIMLFAGAVLYTLSDLPFMERFNSYFMFEEGVRGAPIASEFYNNNPLNTYPFILNLPIRGWFSA